MAQSIQPLRIQKSASSNLSSPTKMNGGSLSRPLAELGPMERRRNSPSYNQATKAPYGENSSPFDSSPVASNSPRLYWQNRDPASPNRMNSPSRMSAENRNPYEGRGYSPAPSPTKRSSIENLKRASRVKNSNIFALEHKHEYDPASAPIVERPLASGRPLNLSTQNHNAPGVKAFDSLRLNHLKEKPGVPQYHLPRSPVKQKESVEPQKSPAHEQSSPTKSSLSKNSRYAPPQAYDSASAIWSDEDDSVLDRELPAGKSLHRHAKSVTFDVAPPQINEYEQRTPDPSSVASGSREGSYDSGDNDEGESFDRGESMDPDDSFDASLEDTEKTPVVLPEDWRFMSPEIANTELTSKIDDPFDGPRSSPALTANPISAVEARSSPTRTDSVNSNGDHRPLPPLPPLGAPIFPKPRSDSNNSLLATAARVSSTQRVLPSPPRPASLSKSDILGMGAHHVPLEDRLRLMMIQDQEIAKNPLDEQRERRMRRNGANREQSAEPEQAGESPGFKIHEDKPNDDDIGAFADFRLPPRISRESILKKVRSQQFHDTHDENVYDDQTASPGRNLENIDPDTPLPSLEGPSIVVEEEEVVIKREEDLESEVDVYAIPEMYRQGVHIESHEINMEQTSHAERMSPSVPDDDGESHYSRESVEQNLPNHSFAGSTYAAENEGPPTPRATGFQLDAQKSVTNGHRLSLGQFASMLDDDDFGTSMSGFMTPSPPLEDEPVKSNGIAIHKTAKEFIHEPFHRPVTPEEQLLPPRFPSGGYESEEEPRTPDSVIRHPIREQKAPDSPGIPEPVATIKAPGGRLKTRPSISPADAESMAETRRQVSAQLPPQEPAIEKAEQEPPPTPAKEGSQGVSTSADVAETEKQGKRKSSLVPLDLSVDEFDEGLSFGLDREFDRVVEAQKVAFALPISPSFTSFAPASAEHVPGEGFRPFTDHHADIYNNPKKGYLMRQNTKMVVATSTTTTLELGTEAPKFEPPAARGTRSAGNSPRKPSNTPTWTTEPWNGKMRRKSIRQSAGTPGKRPMSGPVPPMPGIPSNVTAGLNSVDEDQAEPMLEETEDGSERGRLFVKVVGVKDLDLPLPKGERSYFALTLDNGLHCVTTAWLELGKNAPIGQEFELVVLNDLEFQLTLQTKLEEPKVPRKVVTEPSPTKTAKPSKTSTFSRVFASPKKRKELELKQQQEAEKAAKQKQADAAAQRKLSQPTAWDLLHNLVAKDGSFARAYICLKDHEQQSYGRPFTVDIPCFNEWASEEMKTLNSMRSGRASVVNGGQPTMQRKAPYRIGQLELQLLYVPKPKEAKDEDMPKSMNACIRELQEVEQTSDRVWEGCLSQQGGDCPYWRRRFFRLSGPKLTAYHEATRQPRATINLAKASKLIDDKSALTQKEVSGRGGSRRKSAFAEEEEGYMFVEEGFRVRFANGETIDFYADTPAEKDGWMKALAEVVGKEARGGGSGGKWTDLVMRRRKAEAVQAQAKKRVDSGGRGHQRTGSKEMGNGGGAAATAGARPATAPGPTAATGVRKAVGGGHAHTQSVQQGSGAPAPQRALSPEARRQKTRSMIF